MEWIKKSEHYAYRGGWRQILTKEFELPDGKIEKFDVVSSDDFVTVMAITVTGRLILTRQYRPGPERPLLSFCEGAIDKGETPEAAARRELSEESGYEAGRLTLLKIKQSAYTDQRQYILLAEDCTRSGSPDLDDSEFISTFLLSPKELYDLITDPQEDSFTNIDAAFLGLVRLGWVRTA